MFAQAAFPVVGVAFCGRSDSFRLGSYEIKKQPAGFRDQGCALAYPSIRQFAHHSHASLFASNIALKRFGTIVLLHKSVVIIVHGYLSTAYLSRKNITAMRGSYGG